MKYLTFPVIRAIHEELTKIGESLDVPYGSSDFSPAQYSSHIEGAKRSPLASQIPPWHQPSLRAPVKVAFQTSQYSGPLSYGPFKQESYQPGFRMKSLKGAVEAPQKVASMTSMLRSPTPKPGAVSSPVGPPKAQSPTIHDVASPKPLTAQFQNMKPGALKMNPLPGTKIDHV